MSNVIQLLPDSVANQIAAGEVIQRPASVIKELMENALDAGATEIKVVVKEAGRTLIQVIDNGCGMSETDARMAFERHATSKIKEANDLFALRTMGFRGEALASIAAVAQVELLTRCEGDELGTRIEIAASRIERQESVQCSCGTQFLVKNLFYNIPARRRFLKSNSAELRHIANEFLRVVLANPQISFSLIHNDSVMYALAAGNYRQRVAAVVGKNLNAQLIPVDTETSIVHIHGFIGTPETARKSNGEQYFFVNNRFMKHPYLHRAVMDAYQNLIASDVVPAYFIFLDVDPQIIDVNIHPTKTEIKFEDERIIWQMLGAAVRESLGKFNVVPSIDFDTSDLIDIPVPRRDGDISAPSIQLDPFYNPFEEEKKRYNSSYSANPSPVGSWETLYSGFENQSNSGDDDLVTGDETFFSSFSTNTNEEPVQQSFISAGSEEKPLNTIRFFQLKNRYILTSVKSGLMMIDQKRAHERILFEEYMQLVAAHQTITQKLLFPEDLHYSMEDAAMIEEIIPELNEIGMTLEQMEDDGHYRVLSVPSQLSGTSVATLIDGLLYDFKNGVIDAQGSVKELMVRSMAAQSAIPYGKPLGNEEMSDLFDRLFACEVPNYSPSGKPVIAIIDTVELESRFK